MNPDLPQMLAHAQHIWDTADQQPSAPWAYDEYAEHWAEERRANDDYELAVLTDYEERKAG